MIAGLEGLRHTSLSTPPTPPRNVETKYIEKTTMYAVHPMDELCLLSYNQSSLTVDQFFQNLSCLPPQPP